MIPTILANTASALFHAYLSLTLLHVEAMAELIGAGAPIIWTIGSILMVARLTLHLLPVLFRCVVSPITRCICAVTILTCVATMLLKAYLTFVIFYLAAVSEICNAFGPMWSIGSLVLLERMWRFITLLPALLRSVVFAGRRIITAAVEALISVACDSILPAAYWFLNYIQEFYKDFEYPEENLLPVPVRWRRRRSTCRKVRFASKSSITFHPVPNYDRSIPWDFKAAMKEAMRETKQFMTQRLTKDRPPTPSEKERRNQWYRNENATKIARGDHGGRLGVVVSQISTMALVRLITVRSIKDIVSIVVVRRSDLEFGFMGALDEKDHATTIQRCWRGYIVRTEMRAQANAIKIIQTVWRFHRLLRATSCIQRYWRSKLARINTLAAIENHVPSHSSDDGGSLALGAGSWGQDGDDNGDALEDGVANVSGLGSTTVTGGLYAGDECIVLDYLTHMIRVKLVGSGRITTIRRQSLGLEKTVTTTIHQEQGESQIIKKVRRSPRLAVQR